MLSFAFFCSDLTLNHHLSGDTRVVSTHLPQGIFALHTLTADQSIHNGVLEGVTHVQAACDVRWRDHDAVRVF
ncbi:Uncharacterised protein [Vibrio cholerae]|nr:Uncharacterised protein [Vibrio cholerae]CSB05618.1 Uncharacterised protein [Vibrio cholerae]CSD10682.1 Uncharacterised protein [Vibrio cholerae]